MTRERVFCWICGVIAALSLGFAVGAGIGCWMLGMQLEAAMEVPAA